MENRLLFVKANRPEDRKKVIEVLGPGIVVYGERDAVVFDGEDFACLRHDGAIMVNDPILDTESRIAYRCPKPYCRSLVLYSPSKDLRS